MKSLYAAILMFGTLVPYSATAQEAQVALASQASKPPCIFAPDSPFSLNPGCKIYNEKEVQRPLKTYNLGALCTDRTTFFEISMLRSEGKWEEADKKEREARKSGKCEESRTVRSLQSISAIERGARCFTYERFKLVPENMKHRSFMSALELENAEEAYVFIPAPLDSSGRPRC